MPDDFAERLKYFRSKRDLSQKELAKLVGISNKQISDYEVGTSKPRQSTFIKLLNALGVSDYVFRTANIFKLDTASTKNEIIQLYNARTDKHLSISRDVLNQIYVDPSKILLTTVRGDSMSLTLNDGDMIFVDTSKTDILDGQIYLIDFWLEEMVTRVFKSAGGKLTLSKDNSFYASKIVDYDDIRIIGKVVYRMGQM